MWPSKSFGDFPIVLVIQFITKGPLPQLSLVFVPVFEGSGQLVVALRGQKPSSTILCPLKG